MCRLQIMSFGTQDPAGEVLGLPRSSAREIPVKKGNTCGHKKTKKTDALHCPPHSTWSLGQGVTAWHTGNSHAYFKLFCFLVFLTITVFIQYCAVFLVLSFVVALRFVVFLKSGCIYKVYTTAAYVFNILCWTTMTKEAGATQKQKCLQFIIVETSWCAELLVQFQLNISGVNQPLCDTVGNLANCWQIYSYASHMKLEWT